MKGFTLIELLVVIAVMGIITAVSIPSFNSYTQGQYRKQAAEQLLNDLRSAQSKAQQGVVDGVRECWGIVAVANATAYDIKSYNCASPGAGTTFKTVLLPSTVSFTAAASVIFGKLTGLPGSAVSFNLTNGTVVQVRVESGGNIYVN